MKEQLLDKIGPKQQILKLKWITIGIFFGSIIFFTRINLVIYSRMLDTFTPNFTILTIVGIIILFSIAVVSLLFKPINKQVLRMKHFKEKVEESNALLQKASSEMDQQNQLLEQSNEQLLSIQRIIKEMIQSKDLDKILGIITNSIRNYLSYDHVAVCLLDEKKKILKPIHSYGLNKDELSSLEISLDNKDSFIVLSVLENIPRITKQNIYKNGKMKTQEINIQKGKVAIVPLEAKGKTIGVLVADNLKSDKKIEEQDLRSLVIFTNQMGLAIENARLYQTEKRFNDELQRQLDKKIKELKKAHKQVIQSEKLSALGEMATVVTHEIRNPLATIRMSGELIAEVIQKDHPKRKYVDYIIQVVDELNRVVTDILTFSRMPNLEIKKFDIHKLLDNLCSFLKISDFIKYDIKFSKDYNKTISHIYGDSDQIKQVLLNIIQNACQLMKDRGIRHLTIRTKKNDKGINIEIEDTGIGIPKENFEKIFEPFFTTKAKGTGLGLQISKNIIEAHNGKISVDSKVGVGSIFTISLPIEKRGQERRNINRREDKDR